MGVIEIVLSARLQAIADWIEPGQRVADIGTDHGYLAAWLLKKGGAPSVIATDIRPMPLKKARACAARYGVSPDFRLCDGLSGVAPDEADVIVIAGMGGDTIAGILNARRMKCPLVLQPMSSADGLRAFLYANGYNIARERLVLEQGRLRPVIYVASQCYHTVETGEEYLSRALIESGDPLLGLYVEKLIKAVRRAAEGTRNSSKPHDIERHEYFKIVLEYLLKGNEGCC